MVINYKKMNNKTKGDGYLLPKKDELLDVDFGLTPSIFQRHMDESFKAVAKTRQPLQTRLKKDTVWSWTPQDTDYVDKIKRNVKHLPPVYHPQRDDPLIIETNASDLYRGGVLKAKTSDGQEQVCGYASGTFKPAEKNNEKQILALIYKNHREVQRKPHRNSLHSKK
ncbi:ENZYMATIC POLYPROTEIN-RELATED [Salix koriyanagi]|uniref:ENZYMATIC POLYPROTEIN-RELATED n=1 Tax=Salix koriyanagi TaxID=2511006 RepID=A0A9Q0P718_9ROSI|nr:ENZYMATIC POLYPROTEIN-RELATED [Salix koriyanagi]